MTQDEIQIIIDSNLSSALKSELIKAILDKKNNDVLICLDGGEVGATQEDTKEKPSKPIEPDTEITIGDKTFKVCLAETEKEKTKGLSECKDLPEDGGMLFVYDEPQSDLWFTMEDTSIDLDIIYIDEEGVVTSVNPSHAMQKDPVPDVHHNAKFVLEVNINSGIKVGDELQEFDDDSLSDDEKETAKQSKMLVLDENGDVQMKLEGGERIFSRISTRKFIKAAIKAYRSDSDADYRKVGKLVFKELNAQDDRKPEYVQSPN